MLKNIIQNVNIFTLLEAKKRKRKKETDEGRQGRRSQKGYSLFYTFLTIYIESDASFVFYASSNLDF